MLLIVCRPKVVYKYRPAQWLRAERSMMRVGRSRRALDVYARQRGSLRRSLLIDLGSTERT